MEESEIQETSPMKDQNSEFLLDTLTSMREKVHELKL